MVMAKPRKPRETKAQKELRIQREEFALEKEKLHASMQIEIERFQQIARNAQDLQVQAEKRSRDLIEQQVLTSAWSEWPITALNYRNLVTPLHFDARKYDRVIFDGGRDNDTGPSGFRVESANKITVRDLSHNLFDPFPANLKEHEWDIFIGQGRIRVTTRPNGIPTFRVFGI